MIQNKKLSLSILLLLMAGIISGCSSAAGAASSWPGMAVDADTGFFAYGSQVFAINARNGSLLWQYPADPDNNVQFYAAPEVAEETVYAGSFAGTLAAVNRSNGVKKWEFTQAEDRFVGSPLAADGVVYAPNSDRFLYALSDSGEFLWKFETTGPNWTKPLTDGEFVYFASMDHFVYALDTDYPANALTLDEDGSRTLVAEPVWQADLGTAVVADPVLRDGSIYAATIDGHLHSIDAGTGQVNWTFTNGEGYRSVWGSLVVTDEAVFFGDEAGNIFAVSRESGESLWAAPYSAGSSVIAGGVLTEKGPLFVSEEGRVFTIGLDQEPQPIASLDNVLYAPPEVAGDRVILAPATREKLFMAIDLDGNEVWSFIPSN